MGVNSCTFCGAAICCEVYIQVSIACVKPITPLFSWFVPAEPERIWVRPIC